jgi:predicted transcriptional regulator
MGDAIDGSNPLTSRLALLVWGLRRIKANCDVHHLDEYLASDSLPSERGQPGTMAAIAEGLMPFPEEDEAPLADTKTRQAVLGMLAWALEDGWKGRGGATDFHAFLAFLGVAYRANKLFVGMSQYQLAELIGVNPSTAWRSIRRLERKGLLKREDAHRRTTHLPAENSLAGSYLLIGPENAHRRITLVTTYSSSFLVVSNAPMRVPDAFRTKGGLSKAALRLYEALDLTQAQTPSELADRLSRDVRTVRKRSCSSKGQTSRARPRTAGSRSTLTLRNSPRFSTPREQESGCGTTMTA